MTSRSVGSGPPGPLAVAEQEREVDAPVLVACFESKRVRLMDKRAVKDHNAVVAVRDANEAGITFVNQVLEVDL